MSLRVWKWCAFGSNTLAVLGLLGCEAELVAMDGENATGGALDASGGANTNGGAVSSDGGGANASGGRASGALLPCDVLEDAGHRCVTAHSTVRRLVGDYTGPLYQVCKGTAVPGPDSCQGRTLDVPALGDYADSAAQDEFCANDTCKITVVYDQTGMGNDLEPGPSGGAKPTPDNPANATDLPVQINGRSAYGILVRPGVGYRKLVGTGTAVGDEPQTIYMVTSQHDLVDGCCFDYGNAETTANNDGNGTAEAVYFGGGVIWGTGAGGKPGPWVMADLENGLYAGWQNGQDQEISTNPPQLHDFVTAVLVGDTADKNDGMGRFALYGGDATTGSLMTLWDGVRPEKPGYVPMQKQGSVILGIAGDNSSGGGGRFYEGVMANGAAAQDTLDALQTSIVAARYGR